jgi:hypothetical protein
MTMRVLVREQESQAGSLRHEKLWQCLMFADKVLRPPRKICELRCGNIDS